MLTLMKADKTHLSGYCLTVSAFNNDKRLREAPLQNKYSLAKFQSSQDNLQKISKKMGSAEHFSAAVVFVVNECICVSYDYVCVLFVRCVRLCVLCVSCVCLGVSVCVNVFVCVRVCVFYEIIFSDWVFSESIFSERV